jgi:hypothetical protein
VVFKINLFENAQFLLKSGIKNTIDAINYNVGEFHSGFLVLLNYKQEVYRKIEI